MIDNTKDLITANIAEGPGGFVQGIIEYRKKHAEKLNNNMIGITLKTNETYLLFSNELSKYKNKNKKKCLLLLKVMVI